MVCDLQARQDILNYWRGFKGNPKGYPQRPPQKPAICGSPPGPGKHVTKTFRPLCSPSMGGLRVSTQPPSPFWGKVMRLTPPPLPPGLPVGVHFGAGFGRHPWRMSKRRVAREKVRVLTAIGALSEYLRQIPERHLEGQAARALQQASGGAREVERLGTLEQGAARSISPHGPLMQLTARLYGL